MRELAFWVGPERTHGRVGAHHARRGDLILVRRPLHCYGRQEGTLFLWLTVDGWDTQLDVLQLQSDGPYKYRYHLSLVDLQQVFPTLDAGRLLDPQEEYQPFVDPVPGADVRVALEDGRVVTYRTLRVMRPAIQLPEFPLRDKETGRLVFAREVLRG